MAYSTNAGKGPDAIRQALVERKTLRVTGSNMATCEKGVRYEVIRVAGRPNTETFEVYYWGAQMAVVEHEWLQAEGRTETRVKVEAHKFTRTERLVLEAVLQAYAQLTGYEIPDIIGRCARLSNPDIEPQWSFAWGRDNQWKYRFVQRWYGEQAAILSDSALIPMSDNIEQERLRAEEEARVAREEERAQARKARKARKAEERRYRRLVEKRRKVALR